MGWAVGGWIDLLVGVVVVLCHTCCYILCCCCCCFNVVAGGLRLARVEVLQTSALWPYILLLLLLLLLLFKCSCCWWVGEGWGPAGSRLVASLPTRAGGRSNSWGLQATRSPPARCSIWKNIPSQKHPEKARFQDVQVGWFTDPTAHGPKLSPTKKIFSPTKYQCLIFGAYTPHHMALLHCNITITSKKLRND